MQFHEDDGTRLNSKYGNVHAGLQPDSRAPISGPTTSDPMQHKVNIYIRNPNDS